jgi:hypothetical protein
VTCQAHVRDFAPGQDTLSLAAQFHVTPDGAGLGIPAPPDGIFRSLLDTNGDLILDGTDPASGMASSFVLGSGEHGIGLWIGDDALVVHLPEGTDALRVDDFML